MTFPNLTSTTAELIAYRDELVKKIGDLDFDISSARMKRCHLKDSAEEVIDIINRRESCTHEDFTENLEGRTCRTCGLETK